MLREGQRLFGTDGVRGLANVELTPEFALLLGRAAGELLRGGPVLVGRDTRRSGEMLSAALQAGFHSVGIDTVDVGVLPAGGISYLTGTSGAAMGAVVSASHNPASDNGIKLLTHQGMKLSDAEEDGVEARLRQGPPWKVPMGDLVGTRFPMAEAADTYLGALREAMPYTLRGFELALDCANGASYKVAPLLFEQLKADVQRYACSPDGTNINDRCGATHPEILARLADGRLGLAFDGDADRLVAIDEDGVPANGDVVMAILAGHWKKQGRLRNNTVVATVMSNLGFRKAMDRLDIRLVETKVGDRYVLEAMQQNGAVLGGEQSGHIIFLDRARSGDGLLTAVRLLEVMAGTGKELRELRSDAITEYPQILRNVHVAKKDRLSEAGVLQEAVRAAESQLDDEGRVLVRASGTEPLVRVMVEASSREEALSIADELAALVRRELGE